MGLMGEIGNLNILYFIIPIIAFLLWYSKRKKKRIEMKPEEGKEIFIEPEIIEPERKETPSPRGFEHPRRNIMEETYWKRVVALIGVLAFLIFSISFAWGIANNKFASSSNVVCSEPPKIPDCICDPVIPPCPNITCPPCICPNVSSVCICPNITVVYNYTNSSI